ncbi:MAG: hypothetical protein SFY66_10775 [Oculatellaceae cyanobacterium bins.114]|nr:hypothetical protein [Oculatellaceae cyanobacterium bins.114]
MSQSRIVLDPDIRNVVDQIQAKTRTTSPSAAIALMVSRYGRHLLETWELDPTRYADPNPANYYSPSSSSQVEPDFKFSDPIQGF